ncbi:efflux RND transporter permease subunit [Stenotrophomonas aracearum]|uniref:Efflux RND transporter permease subunit n=1 Tax=Stenotrophomonas aracearum TaxID=3003272 RepID=A0ABY9Y967_9GAMM|nr:efflux RND transporter permease subunit [Stenotrophomonas sp. A5588]WNH47419.1 efflux RND transporter permease subunit [Stenotrophomonas sp. A5588]
MKISIEEVVKTLVEAIVLVFLVMLIFLQNFRATLIPTLVIPVALLGTFLGMSIIGFTINQLTLFAMVLAIGIVVDDAIVVIENVERIMTEEKLPPKAATQKAMTQITGAVVAITVVLAAVFIPSALQGGAAGEIYKQFALTIAIAMAFSAFLALGFTPALCATFLKPTHGEPNVVYRTFNKYYDKVSGTYVGHITSAVKHAPRWMILFVVLTALCGFLFTRMPGSFLRKKTRAMRWRSCSCRRVRPRRRPTQPSRRCAGSWKSRMGSRACCRWPVQLRGFGRKRGHGLHPVEAVGGP